MISHRHLLAAGLALTLAACATTDGTPSDGSASSGASSVSSVTETPNVSYQGVIEDAGTSIYMQGTHRLSLDDGRFVLLESSDLDLGRYVGKRVAVLGSTRPTVEEGGIIMRVEQIVILGDASSSSSSQESSSEESSNSSSSEEMSSEASSDTAMSEPASSRAAVVSSAQAVSSAAVVSSAFSGGASSLETSADLDAKGSMMARASMADSNWTQEYCSQQHGFCFPVHKNWWYQSFGATTSYLWHVEIGPEEITNLGEGPLVINLVAGSIASAGQSDGAVVAQGDFVVGYKAFNETSHFEISAPAALQAAVSYLTTHIQAQ